MVFLPLVSIVMEGRCGSQEISAKRDGAATVGGSPIPESHSVFTGQESAHDPTAQQRPLSAQVCHGTHVPCCQACPVIVTIRMRSSSLLLRSCGGARSWTSAPSASGAASRRSSPGPPPAPATDSDSDSDSDCAPAPVPSAACLARARCAIRHGSTSACAPLAPVSARRVTCRNALSESLVAHYPNHWSLSESLAFSLPLMH